MATFRDDQGDTSCSGSVYRASSSAHLGREGGEEGGREDGVWGAHV
jgi:hypothetical protein